MKLFNNKNVEFIPAFCPNCKCNLEIDSNFEVAYCSFCGLRCIINDRLNKKQKQNNLDKVISFVERQQNIKREIKRQEEIKLEKQDEENKMFWKKYGYLLIVFLIMLFIFIFIMAYYENLGVIMIN